MDYPDNQLFIAVFQFIPIIRHKAILVHRVNGYIAVLLMIFAVAGGWVIAPKSYGGTPFWQAGIFTLGLVVLLALLLAWINILRLQIDQHRAWMLSGSLLKINTDTQAHCRTSQGLGF